MNPNMLRRTKLVYGFLLAVWAVIVVWQIVEHNRVKEAARAALINRSKDITTTLGLVIRSQRRFWGGVSQERVESALKELVKSDELSAVALLNASGEVVASAGEPIDLEAKGMMQAGEHWDYRRVSVVNLVDLGASVTREGETNRPIIVFPRRDPTNAPRSDLGTNDPGASIFAPPGATLRPGHALTRRQMKPASQTSLHPVANPGLRAKAKDRVRPLRSRRTWRAPPRFRPTMLPRVLAEEEAAHDARPG